MSSQQQSSNAAVAQNNLRKLSHKIYIHKKGSLKKKGTLTRLVVSINVWMNSSSPVLVCCELVTRVR